jgi:CDP-glucose 4,6-dehydratase
MTFWNGRPVLVTGATGLLGSWLLPRLIDAGADVVCLVRDREAERAPGPFARARVVRGDVRHEQLLRRILDDHRIDTVLHLAAQAIVTVANLNPLSTWESNVRGTWALLEACRQSPHVRQIVLASSDKAYGDHGGGVCDESAPFRPTNPYDVSKACADLIARSYAETYGTPVAITRCGNFFGGGDLNWNRLVPGTIRSIVRGERPRLRSNGQFVRDWFYVEDGAAAYMLLAEKLAADPSLRGEAFNFSTEERTTALELVERICTLMGSTAAPDIQASATSEILEQRLSAEKARRRLGWSSRYHLDEGLSRTIAWYQGFFQEHAA